MKLQNPIKAILFALGMAFIAMPTVASAADDGSYLLAYAEPESASTNPFDQFEYSEDAHEMNDAWLGMPAISNEGEFVGVVADAFIDEYGNVSEIRLDLASGDHAVYVEGSQVMLWDNEVAIDLPSATIAQLEPADDGVMLTSR